MGELRRPVEDAIVSDFIPALLDIQQRELTPLSIVFLATGSSKAA